MRESLAKDSIADHTEKFQKASIVNLRKINTVLSCTIICTNNLQRAFNLSLKSMGPSRMFGLYLNF
jgi:hypothetical protein